MLRSVVPGVGYWTGVLPGLLVFGFGLAAVVAPVTATVPAAAPDRYAGIASGGNNAVARTGGLVAVAVLPAAAGLTGAQYADPTAMTRGRQTALLVCAVASVVGGLLALGVDNRVLEAAQEHHDPHSCPVDGPPVRT
ncbi:hypothetical protein ACRAKI_02105 [Saccharothrix isguenensis]